MFPRDRVPPLASHSFTVKDTSGSGDKEDHEGHEGQRDREGAPCIGLRSCKGCCGRQTRIQRGNNNTIRPSVLLSSHLDKPTTTQTKLSHSRVHPSLPSCVTKRRSGGVFLTLGLDGVRLRESSATESCQRSWSTNHHHRMHRCSHRAGNEAETLSKKKKRRREIEDKLHKDDDDGER